MNRILSRSGRKCIKCRQNFIDAPKLSLTLTESNFTKLKIAERHYVWLFCTEFDPGWSVSTGNACKNLFQACKISTKRILPRQLSVKPFMSNLMQIYTDGIVADIRSRTDGLTSPHHRLVLYFVKNA